MFSQNMYIKIYNIGGICMLVSVKEMMKKAKEGKYVQLVNSTSTT